MCCDYCKTVIPDHKPVHRVPAGWYVAEDVAVSSVFLDLCTECAARMARGAPPAPMARARERLAAGRSGRG